MMVYSVSQPDLYAEYFDRVIMPRRRWLHTVLREGIDSGELRADLDVELAAMAIVGTDAAADRTALAATRNRTQPCRSS